MPKTTRPPALLTKRQIQDRIHELGKTIQGDYTRNHPEQTVTIVSILKGAIIFTGDLIRCFDVVGINLEVVQAQSYKQTQSKDLKINWDLIDDRNIHERHVLVVDDIIDTGKT